VPRHGDDDVAIVVDLFRIQRFARTKRASWRRGVVVTLRRVRTLRPDGYGLYSPLLELVYELVCRAYRRLKLRPESDVGPRNPGASAMSAVRVEPIAIPACLRGRGGVFGGFGWDPRSAVRALEHRFAADRMCFRTAARRQRGDARRDCQGAMLVDYMVHYAAKVRCRTRELRT
jgi:hypothetical protein